MKLMQFIRGILLCCLLMIASAVVAQQSGFTQKLQLEVTLNGQKTNLIASFVRLPDGMLAAERSELEEVGIKVPSVTGPQRPIPLTTVPNLKYVLNEQTQSIAITIPQDQQVTRTYNAREVAAQTPVARSNYGAVLNYSLFGTSGFAFPYSNFDLSGASATLDARAFSRFGVFAQSGILGTTTFRDAEALRLDSTYTYTDQNALLTYRVGDGITGGLVWTRPIRFGGVQVQRNFGLRDDLVTSPLPSISGNAAVPSTVDVYVNNVRMLSQSVGAGPYTIANLPVLSGGNARVVLRDPTGRETESTLPFYSSPALLKPGLLDFSAETGLPRLNYATLSDNYVSEPFASVSLRYGLLEWLSLESHGEFNERLSNFGAGLVTRIGSFGILSLAASGSVTGQMQGSQFFAAYETKILGAHLNISTQRTFGEYNDLASINIAPPDLTAFLITPLNINPRPPKALDRATLSFALPDFTTLSLNIINYEPVFGPKSQLIGASVARSFFGKSNAFLTAFADLNDRKGYGVFAGLSIPLGTDKAVSFGVSSATDGTRFTLDASKAQPQEVGTYGWRFRDSEGKTPYRSAAVSYRTPFGRADASVAQYGELVRTTGEFQGSIIAMNSGVHFSNRIDDSFAIVDVGAANVTVLYENRPIGKTNNAGVLVVPSLRAYQANKLSIDPRGLPVNAEIPVVQEVVVPADRSGVVVKFGVNAGSNAASIVLVGRNGKHLAVGSIARVNGQQSEHVIGYDGRLFVRNLKATNFVVVDIGSGKCRATFPFSESNDSIRAIGPIVCL
ncbi:MAG: fimbria/pilus outer membrane usher protein [Xanthobacteraceae bacterium]|nr:fimbria/pilus outer membrane usher protein [Xanthobacteraceae bacterium]